MARLPNDRKTKRAKPDASAAKASGARRREPEKAAPAMPMAPPAWRARVVLLCMGLVASVLVARAAWLQLFDDEFLARQGALRQQRFVPLAAHRGMIVDRNDEPLAVSVPVDSIWADPRKLKADEPRLEMLAQLLQLSEPQLRKLLKRNSRREFVWLERRMEPNAAERVMDLNIKGVSLRREYRRFYPTAEVNGHLLGYTDIDDNGQEGLERAYDAWLRGEPGRAHVVRDRLGRPVAEIDGDQAPRAGANLQITLDRRIQFLAYRSLKKAVKQHGAVGGTVVVVDVPTGGILALANQPAFNPNDRSQLASGRLRNRALTDLLEPGSTVKPFVVAAALQAGLYEPDSRVDTSPGHMLVSGRRIADPRDYGPLGLAEILKKSSNMGAARLALNMPGEVLWSTYDGLGFGKLTATNFPGERDGRLKHYHDWRQIDQAVMSFGYSFSVTPVQLAQAYTALAANGRARDLTFVADHAKLNRNERQVFTPEVAKSLIGMMETVVQGSGGTGSRAAIPGYRVAGKTGTAKKFVKGRYSNKHYQALFAGMAPASAPRIVAVVILDEPKGRRFHGGQVAAPVFSDVVSGALRLLNVRPDAVDKPTATAGVNARSANRADAGGGA